MSPFDARRLVSRLFLMATNSTKTKILQPAPDLTFHRFVAALQGHVVTFLGSQRTSAFPDETIPRICCSVRSYVPIPTSSVGLIKTGHRQLYTLERCWNANAIRWNRSSTRS